MATERIRTIKPAGQGGDYTSLAAWEAAEQADLVSLDEVRIGEIDGTWSSADTTAVTINGWTTDSTRYIIVRAVGTASHIGKWNTNAYKIVIINDNGLTLDEDYSRVEGIQISATFSAGTTQYGAFYALANNCIFISCIAKGTSSGDSLGTKSGFRNAGTGTININCIAFGFTGATNTTLSGFQNGLIYNCTSYGSNLGFRRLTGTSIVKNCLAQNCTDGFSGSFDVSSTNNLSDTASDAPGSNPITATVNFVDAANGDFHLTSNNPLILRAGKDLSSDSAYAFNTDIDGEYRILYWDIGADQYVNPHKVKLRGDKITAKKLKAV